MMRMKDDCVKAVESELWRSVAYRGGESDAGVSHFWRREEEQGNSENKGEVTGAVLHL